MDLHLRSQLRLNALLSDAECQIAKRRKIQPLCAGPSIVTNKKGKSKYQNIPLIVQQIDILCQPSVLPFLLITSSGLGGLTDIHILIK